MCVNVLKLVACSFILGSFGRGWFPALSKYEHVVKENPRNICIFLGGGVLIFVESWRKPSELILWF